MKKKTNSYYDRIASIYDRTRWLTNNIADEVADMIINLVNANLKTSFLELGVGTGLNVFPLVKKGYFVTGIDVSEEMLNQFKQKFDTIPDNLALINDDASQLPFEDHSFDVILTVHMVHGIGDRTKFFQEIDRVLKPQGYYLNCQWITPPARMEFENYFRDVLVSYGIEKKINHDMMNTINTQIKEYFENINYKSNYIVAKEWEVSNTVKELLGYYRDRAYGLCWLLFEQQFNQAMIDFEQFCLNHYHSEDTELSSTAKFEIWSNQKTQK
ncbi:class I SAM-dependent methyltransferase [Cyanobacterium aponinum FACHB-4101]|uniref:class I SAM-dependent methyltransferase n=1 Tax=Cyanobacterium aponinum TaxID=379064 RepID=UPI0016805F16|nr:class I SAM-dependent methyltransferase [Cyanobacterium aponinum]MBD2394563.1 class I SAM-dependent methyltransferase [Cyanobacterium aponinum FACHB-4101]